MPKDQTETQSLADFSFDNSSFFGIDKDELESATSKTIKQVKGQEINKGNDSPASTDIHESSGTSKKGSKAGKQDDFDSDDNDSDDNDEEITFFEDKPKKPTAKVKEESEEIDEEEVEVKPTKKKIATKTKEEDEDDTEEGNNDNKTTKVKPKTKPKVEDNDDEEGNDDDDDNKNDDKDDKFFGTLATEMKEKGIFQNVEIKNPDKLTEEQFFELQDEEIEARVNETIEALIEDLDDDGKDFIKFKKNGGKTADFFATYSIGLNIDKFDEDNPDHVQQVLNHYLVNFENLDADELKDRLTWIKDRSQEKAYATKYFTKIEEAQVKAKKTLEKATEQATEAREKKAKVFSESINKILTETETIGAFPISKSEQKELGNYINKPLVKIGKNKYIPQINADLGRILRAETKEDKQTLIVLAKLLKKNFDVSDLIVKAETKIARKTESKLREIKNNIRPSSSGSSTTKRSIAEFFDE